MKSFKLGDVCLIAKGKTITRATASEGSIPVIGGGLGPTYFHNVANCKSPVITISASGANAGFVNYWDQPIWASDCTTIVEKPGSPASIRYIYKFLQSKQEFINKELRRGSAQPHVYPSDIADLQIFLPPLEKQLELVERLDYSFSEINALEANLLHREEKAIQLRQSLLHSTFHPGSTSTGQQSHGANQSFRWKFVPLGEVCNLMTGGTPSRSCPEYYENGTIKWLVSGDINQTEIFDCEGRITLEAMKSSNAKILPLNSVMIALNGQGKTRGTVALLRTEAACNQSLVSISPKVETELSPEFLFHNLRMRYQELRRITGDDGNDRRGLNMILIRQIEIPLPPFDLQQEIVDKLNGIYKEVDAMQSKINAERKLAALLLKSQLHNSFNTQGASV